MNSKERVRCALARRKPDRIPAAFEAVSAVVDRLKEHYGYDSIEQIYDRYDIDIIPLNPEYIGPKLKQYVNENGEKVTQTYWGSEDTSHQTTVDLYSTTSFFPLNGIETIEDLDAYSFPNPDWFDYEGLRQACEKHPDKAIIIGHPGPFQIVTTNILEMDEFFMLMVDNPELVKELLKRLTDFEVEYYRRCFEACRGQIDILRTHDDYGTQISLLFGRSMWKEFFEENTRRLVNLAHQYGAFFQQHSCGAIAPLIPELIDCGVDSLEPLQKVPGLYAEDLAKNYLGKITFHGGIDTQALLPFGTAEEVQSEAEKYMRLLGQNGGYILMASQGFENDVSIENIEAVYRADRTVS